MGAFLHNVLGLVVSLSWIWQGRTLFMSMDLVSANC